MTFKNLFAVLNFVEMYVKFEIPQCDKCMNFIMQNMLHFILNAGLHALIVRVIKYILIKIKPV